MIDNAVSSLAHHAIDATSDRLHDTTERLQDLATARKPRKRHRLLRAMLFTLVVSAVGTGVFLALQRRSQSHDIAPDPFGDAAEREQRARDYARVP